MKEGPDIAGIAALIGDPARANMLTALMSDRALTAAELAAEAGITPQTASGHLAKLTEAGLLQVRKQGRHKYFALGSGDVATTLEALMGLAAGQGRTRTRTGPKDARLRQARVCYNHLAGRMGVQMYDSMLRQGLIKETVDEIRLTGSGATFVTGFGIDLTTLGRARAPLCRTCLDWSERRTHLAGSVGRAMLAVMETQGWARRDPESRAILFTPAGRQAFDNAFPQ